MFVNDLVFTLGSMAFLIALIPSITTEHKPDKATSLMTSSVLYLFTLNYLSMELYFSAIVGFATASAWLILYFQVRKADKKIESNFST
jgi:hypothetical protein